MADYVRTTWIDEVLADVERFDIKDNGGTEIHGNVQIALKTGVTQAGTAVDATRLNNMETGIIAMEVHTKTSKTTPVDADEIGLWDSVATTLKKLTWQNLKATLKTYFDTLYPGIASTAMIRVMQIPICDANTVLVTGDGAFAVRGYIPLEFNGMNLVDVQANCSTASTSGLPTIQINNVTQAADMLLSSYRLTIDANEKTSRTAATAAQIDTANDDVATGDEIRIDIDVAGTGTKGLSVTLSFKLP